MEQLGSGVPRILKSYSKNNFIFMEHFIRMTFPAIEPVYDDGGSIGGSIGGAIGGAIELTDRQNEVLEIIKANNKIGYRIIAKLLKINESAVKKHLNALKEKGVLKRVGGTRGHWEIIEK